MPETVHQKAPSAFTLGCDDLGLATDLYQLTMAAAYHARRRDRGGGAAGAAVPRAAFELSVRRLPANRNFLVFAGLEQAVASLAGLRFTSEQVAWLRRLPQLAGVDASFFAELESFRFSGEVWALPEGTVFFPGEPVMRVVGSEVEAQLVETLLLSIVNFQVSIASKAARIRLAAGREAGLAEFGSRRAHGPQAAAWVARAAYLAGFDSTSNVLAGYRQGVPVAGTMAHSYVMSFADEVEAFRHYQAVFPDHAVLLVDTYDPLEGVRRALATGRPFAGVRLDSGDLGELAFRTREVLDAGGRQDARIFVSGDLDEGKIAALRRAGAPVDSYGVGTELATSADAPALSGIYKLVAIEEAGGWRPTFKASSGKATYPGIKQVMRRHERGRMAEDRVVPAAADGADEGLLVAVMRGGEPLPGTADLEAARRRCRDQLAELPDRLQRLEVAETPYPVTVDARIEELLARLRDEPAATAVHG